MEICNRMIILFVSVLVFIAAGCGDTNDDGDSDTTILVTYVENNADSGGVPVDNTDYKDGQSVTVAGNSGTLVRQGYTFNGWCLNSSGLGITYTEGQNFVMGDIDIILYAKWVSDSIPSGQYVADYTIAKESVLRRIPGSAINAAKDDLHILYCGTSHSQQVMEGMKGLEQYKAGDDTLFAFTYNGTPVSSKLDIHYRGASGTDLSADGVDGNDHTGYFNGTVSYLDSHSDVNVVMWSWCSIEGHDVQVYIDNFDELTLMYSDGGSKGRTASNVVTFVWMTGYARGSHGDENGAVNSPYNNHKAIVDHCNANGYFCLDYWSQDVYDYGDDTYKPYESGNANVQHYNYVQTHTLGQDWFECRNWSSGSVDYPAHTDDSSTYAQHLTGNRRAYAAWWLWARIAGWDGALEN